MKRKLVMAIVIVLSLVFLVLGCDILNNEEKGEEVDFTSHNVNFSIRVRNGTNQRLVAFKGDIHPDYLLGGVPAHANNHAFAANPTLFDKTEAFPLYILTEAQYNTNKDNLIENTQLKNAPFTRVFIFYNKQGENNVVYEISGSLGGSNKLNIVNASNSINVELRLGGVAGETIGYAPAGMLNTTLYMIDGDHNVFPVFKRYNNVRDVVETVYPQGSGSNYAWFQQVTFGEGTTEHTMNLKSLLSGINFSNGAAWVVINNQTTSGAINFYQGTNIVRTASGISGIPNGNNRTYQIDMPRVQNKYDDSVIISNWSFGPSGFDVGLQTSESDSTLLDSFKIERDKMYTITVNGDHNDNSLKAWISSLADIQSADMAGTW